MNQELTNMQKNIGKAIDDVSGKLDNLSFESAKDSLDQATKQARDNVQNVSQTVREASQTAGKAASQAMRDGMDHSQRLNETVSKQASTRVKEYSEFVMDHPISATAGAFFLGYVIARWTR